MADETKAAPEQRKEQKKAADDERSKVGAEFAGLTGIVLVTSYLILLSVLLLYALVQVWPAAPGAVAAQNSSSVWLFFWKFAISHEVRLLLIVALAGALGSMVHALRSLYWYVGNRKLVVSWLVKYILLPFVGAALALVFYFVIRGGFFSPGPESAVQQTNTFGFAALAGLVGMFSEQAVLKLQKVAETLLTKPEPGEDKKPQESTDKK